ncbi:hypothetical protein JDV02_009079 [Purpureocillium takamizusanense]|uniref:Uncharacterized protein n=1 Tax=Purpureocillium takamizusanense TaxID=2060973 RepID=A0A9Q8QPY5_9HYPO|nr:uncharacterized protein JDV02_009079 [Purpureocillium takamizusanense]UNI23247.1 hypothetical protein JDV02_009079 [Purpureocillium takamizusanense]
MVCHTFRAVAHQTTFFINGSRAPFRHGPWRVTNQNPTGMAYNATQRDIMYVFPKQRNPASLRTNYWVSWAIRLSLTTVMLPGRDDSPRAPALPRLGAPGQVLVMFG